MKLWKFMILVAVTGFAAGCAAKAIVKTDSCHKVEGTDETLCDKVTHLYR